MLRSESQRRAISRGLEEAKRFELYARERRYMEALWHLVSKPLKFPDRRRRQDREIPRAA